MDPPRRPSIAARRVLLAPFTAIAVAFSPCPGIAQQQLTTGTVQGRVSGASGQPVAGAEVSIRRAATGLERTAITGDDGRFVFSLLPPGGRYALTASALGYARTERTDVRVAVGERLSLDVVLTVTPVEVGGIDVSVRRGRTVERGGVVERVTEAEAIRLPVRSRDFTGFLALSPLVGMQPEIETGGRFAIAGARASGTSLQVDGVDANNLFFAESQGSSRSPFAYSLESIGEIQLVTNGFDVEYGNYQGGIVNAVTRSGTNDLDGSVFVYHRDEALTGRDFAREPPTAFRVTQFGATISGPIVRDRAHWFAALDLQAKRLPVDAGSAIAARIEPAQHDSIVGALESVYGLPGAGRYFGSFTGAEDNAVAFARVDWDLGDAHHLTVRQNWSSFHQQYDGQERDEAITNSGRFRDRVASTALELNSVLGARTTSSFRLQLSREDRPRRPDADGGYLPRIDIDNLEGTGGGIARLAFGGDERIYRNRLEEGKLQLVENLTWRAGDHTLKLGTSDILSDTRYENWVEGNGTYLFPNVRGLLEREPVSYTRLARSCPSPLLPNRAGEAVICPDPDVPVVNFRAFEWSVYAQDEWRVTDALAVTAGLRYGGIRLDQSPDRVPALEQAFGVSSTAVPSFHGLSPRIAFSLETGGHGNGVVRGGAGLLVGRAPLVLAADAFETERPLRRILCSRSDAPTLDLDELLRAERGALNPAACRSGPDAVGRPAYTVFDADFALPRTVKANLGFETAIGGRAHLSVDVIASRTSRNYRVVDENLLPVQFRLPTEPACDGCAGRPVFVARATGPAPYDPRKAAGRARLRDPDFDRVLRIVSDGEARAVSLLAEVRSRHGPVELAARFAHTRAYDNGTFSCCTSQDGFAIEPTAGDPNAIGRPGDASEGAWGPSSVERRNVIVASALADGPWGIRLNALLRMQSGTPWTPIVAGDVNADGDDRNDRPYVGTGLYFTSASDSALWLEMLEIPCLADQVGGIARRNSCRNPWWNSLDLRVSKEFATWRSQHAELTLDAFNVLNGLSARMGQLVTVSGERRVLLSALRHYDPDAAAEPGTPGVGDAVLYRVNPAFGRHRPVSYEPFQFQVQLGARYRF